MLFNSVLKALSVASLIGSTVAQPLQHQHNLHKRDVVFVTQTVVTVVTVDGQAPAPAATEAAAPAPVEEAKADTTTQAPAPAPTTTTQAPAPATTTSSTKAAATTASAPTSGSAGAAGAKGITYSPYTPGGCKSTSDVASDLASLTGFDVIRIYGVDCNQVANVFAGKAAGQKVFIGIYDMGSIADDVSTIAAGVNGNWADVETVSVGNELVNSGAANPSQVAGYVSQARSALSSAGYSGPVVAVDTFIAVINNPELCEYSDYIAVNAHAFFDGGVAADGAGDWVLQQIERVWTACGGSKSVLITETGWPSQGDTNGKAVPSKPNQEAAISSIKSSCGASAVLFTAFNDYWKAPGAFNAEQYWGIYSS